MFVDSHCHLDFPELAADLPRCSTRWRAHGVTHALCIAVEPARLAGGARARDRARQPLRDASACIRTTRTRPSRRSTTSSRSRRGPRSSRSAKPGSTTIGCRATSNGSASAFARTSAPRATRGKPLVIHTRARGCRHARDHARGARGRCRRRDALLHRDVGGRARRARPRASTSRSRASSRSRTRTTLKDVARRVPLDRMLIETDCAVPRAGAVPRQAQPAGLRAARRGRRSRGCAACRSRRSARRPARTSFASSGSIRTRNCNSHARIDPWRRVAVRCRSLPRWRCRPRAVRGRAAAATTISSIAVANDRAADVQRHARARHRPEHCRRKRRSGAA